ncbi:MAG: hypothetical protein IJN50_06590 [Clostridia bacterium]|nr:hypothetical protein [Clostridia bacterium]
MNSNAKQFRTQLQNMATSSNNEIPDGLDMNRRLTILLIDDDIYLEKAIKLIVKNVTINTISIDDILREMSNEEGLFLDVDMIFIDTFYKDDKSDKYALEYFDMYRKSSPEAAKETNGKYKVIMNITEMNERLSSTNQDTLAVEERTKIAGLFNRVQNHPNIQWGKNIASKTDKIIQSIREYAQRNNIYLFSSHKLTLQEWLAYFKWSICEVSDINNSLKQLNIPDDKKTELLSIVSGFNSIINNLSTQLPNSKDNSEIESKITSTEQAIDCAKKICSDIQKERIKIYELYEFTSDENIFNVAHRTVSLYLGIDFYIEMSEENNTPAPQLEQSNLE